MGGAISMEPDPFAEGATRWAFKGVVTRHGYKGFERGSSVIVKAIKAPEYNSGVRLSQDDILAQLLTKAMCVRFNELNFVNKKVYTRPAQLITAKKTHYNRRGAAVIGKGEALLLEQEIHGEYEKFNSNSGWANDEVSLPQFLSHWSWVESKGQFLICDLQGHRGRPGGPKWDDSHNYYVFTDPVVMTKRPGLMGCGDLGMDGIVQWFDGHTCNDLCRGNGIASKRPEFEGNAISRPQIVGSTFIPRGPNL